MAGRAEAVALDGMLDRELVARAERAGDFWGIAPRMGGQARQRGLELVCFVMLLLDDTSLMKWPYRQRRQMLEALELGGSS